MNVFNRPFQHTIGLLSHCTRVPRLMLSPCRSLSSSAIKEALQPINYHSVKQLADLKWKEVSKKMEKYGFVIFNSPSTNSKTTNLKIFLDTCRLFGPIQGHARADKNGVVEIRSNSLAIEGKHVVTDMSISPHTDGSYARGGIAFRGSMAHLVVPPKIIILRSIVPNVEGGTNLLVDGEAIFKEISKKNPDLLRRLCAPGVICSVGKNVIAHHSVFEVDPVSLRVQIYYSYDNQTFVRCSDQEALDIFHNEYVLNPKFTIHCQLAAGQILILDNRRMLHGRTSITGNRLTERVWVVDEANSCRMVSPAYGFNPHYKSRDIGAEEPFSKIYEKYLPVSSPPLEFRPNKLETGFKISLSQFKLIQYRHKSCNRIF